MQFKVLKIYIGLMSIFFFSLPTLGSDNYIKLQHGIDDKVSEIESKIGVSPDKAIYVSHDNNPIIGNSLFWLRNYHAFNGNSFGYLDFGFSYEVYDPELVTLSEILGMSGYKDTASGFFSTAAYTYIFNSSLITNVDLTFSTSIYNQSLQEMFRVRASAIYKPFERLSLVYRGSITNPRDELTKVTNIDFLKGNRFLFAHEMYIGYDFYKGLEPYILLKDMKGSGEFNAYLGVMYKI